MKKVTAIFSCAALLFVMFAMPVFAAKSYQVPKAAQAPILDGVIDADEWANALFVEMKKGDTSLAVPAGDLAQFQGTKLWFMWADEGIYFAAEVMDNTPPTIVPEAANGSYNSGDGVQFNMFPTRDTASENGEIFFFSYHPKTSNGLPAVGEHFVYGTGATGADVPEAKIASKVSADKYIVEGLIPTDGLKKSNTPINVKSGAVLYWNNVIMEEGGNFSQGLVCDGEWFTAAGANEYTLTDAVAGKVEQPQTSEAAADTPSTPATTNPSTSDAGIAAIMAVLAISAAGTLVVGKKAKK